MHGVMITFRSSAPASDLVRPFEDYARALQSIPGLVSKTWIHADSTFGGFHVFADRSAAEHYLASDLAAGLMATSGFTDFEVRHFDVLDDLSAMTGPDALVG